MNRVRPGSCIHVPIRVDSTDSSDHSLEDELSTVTFQTAASAVHGIINQEAVEVVEAMENVVNSYTNANAYRPFVAPANTVYYGEMDPIQAIQVPFAMMDFSGNNEGLAQRAPPQLPTGGHGHNNNMPNEALGFQVHNNNMPNDALGIQVRNNNMPNEALGIQVQGAEVSLPRQVNGVRRSSRKRNEAIYNEYLLANTVPRLARRKGESCKKKPTTSLRIRACNHYLIDTDEEYESE